jgi:ABC-2 type transport system ATP-binding protein
VAIIHRGRLLINGDVESVRQSTGMKVLRLAVAGDDRLEWTERFREVTVQRRTRDFVEMQIPDEDAAQRILQHALTEGMRIERFEVTFPSLNDIFLDKVRADGGSREDIEHLEATSRSEAVA